MKKKRNLLTIISSILGVFVICGAFCCSLFIGSDKKATPSKADTITETNSQLVNTYPINFDFKYLNSLNVEVTFHFECSMSLIKTTTIYVDDSSNDIISSNLSISLKGLYTWSFSNSDIRITNGSFNHSISVSGSGASKVYDGDFKFTTKGGELNGPYIYVYFNDELYTDRIDIRNYTGKIAIGSGIPSSFSSVFNAEESEYILFTYNTNSAVGYEQGYAEGFAVGSSSGYDEGYAVGYDGGFADGVASQSEIITNSYNSGYSAGVESQQSVIQASYSQGYTDGYNEADAQDEVVSSIFSGIVQVAFVPINFFLSIFNFEILGINISAFIKALFTLMITLYVFRIIFSGGNGGGEQ